MRIRRARREEIGKIAKICHDEIYDELPLNDIEEWLINTWKYPYHQYFIVERDGEIIGFIDWSLFDRYGNEIILEIASIAIKKNYQRKGVGKKLLENSLKKVKKYWSTKGLKVALYFVDTEEENEKAWRFYEEVIRPSKKVLIPNVFEGQKAKIFYFKKCRVPK